MDESFLSSNVLLRLAENEYSLRNTFKCEEWLDLAAKIISDKDRYLVHLVRGKVFDKKRQFQNASQEFEISSQIVSQFEHEKEIVGAIDFRLGWALVRSKRNIQKGIEKLLSASACLPENTDLLRKLSGVIYSERPTEGDLRHGLKLMNRCILKWRNDAPAIFLKGKIHIKLHEFVDAIQLIEKAI